MTDVIITGENGRLLRLSAPERGTDGSWTYSAEFTTEAAHGSAQVYDYGDPWLPTFFADLADCWRGFDGERSFDSLEGQLSIVATHDGKGTVQCMVTLGQLWPPTWMLRAEIDLGAGAHLDQIATDVRHLFSIERQT